MNEKDKHKQQLINSIIDYFYKYKPKTKIGIKEKLNKLSYRKVKRISKALGIYQKYYDDSLTEADYYSWYRL